MPLMRSSTSLRQSDLQPQRRRYGLPDILIPYDTRKQILSYLSAFDIAKLNLILDILDDTERHIYLNPARDIIWDMSKMSSLTRKGMKLILCGNDVPLLSQRLYNTRKYLRAYGHKRRLQIYLIGVFPFRLDVEPVHDRMLRFSISKEPCNDRISKDKRELGSILQVLQNSPSIPKGNILMSFGAPIEIEGRSQHRRSIWYAEPDLPDRTIDLKLYVPSYDHRFIGEIVLPRSEIPGLFGFACRKTCLLWLLITYSRIVTNRIQLHHMSYLTSQGLLNPRSQSVEGTLRFHFGPCLLSREFPF